MARAFEANDAFFDQLLFSPPVVAICETVAKDTEGRAIAGAPVVSGEYKREIGIERHDTAHRPVFRVVAKAPHSMKVESKTGNLARSLRGGRSA